MRVREGTNAYDLWLHLIGVAAVLIFSILHLFRGVLRDVSLGLVIIIFADLYLFILLALAALKISKPLPARQVALLTIPALLLILVMSFADLYIKNGNIKRLNLDNKVEVLNDPWNGTYFSLVTITTLGYGDYTPQEWSSRKIVIGELLSGALLLLFAIPVLASRLALFEGPPGAKTVLGIQRLESGSWTVQTGGGSATSYGVSKSLTIEVVAQSEIKISGSA